MRTFQLVAINAGTSDPSSTQMLARRIIDATAEIASARGHQVQAKILDLRPLATDITTAMTSGILSEKLQKAALMLRDADGIVAAAPVYKAGPSGLFTSFIHILDDDLLIAKPVILGATAGTARHALVVDEQMRSLFAYLRTIVAPTAVFASTEDWAENGMAERIDRAAFELQLLMESGFATAVREHTWKSYQHSFGSDAGSENQIDLDTDLMRLATGGR